MARTKDNSDGCAVIMFFASLVLLIIIAIFYTQGQIKMEDAYNGPCVSVINKLPDNYIEVITANNIKHLFQVHPKFYDIVFLYEKRYLRRLWVRCG